ncbi:hypothetical protein TNCV_525511 [Trichonephila clavipes]|nr:hypothetical protein TNCV_525511 [Trichonephila clavipes]
MLILIVAHLGITRGLTLRRSSVALAEATAAQDSMPSQETTREAENLINVWKDQIEQEPIRGSRFATREDTANAGRQQETRFTHGAAIAEADGIQRLPRRWQHVVIVAGDYIEGV